MSSITTGWRHQRHSRKGFSPSVNCQDLDLPFVVHTRGALEDIYAIIKSEGVGPRGGIMHSFSVVLKSKRSWIWNDDFLLWSGDVKKATDVKKRQLAFRLIRYWLRLDALIWHQFLSGARKIKQPTPAMLSGSYCSTTWLDNRRSSSSHLWQCEGI